MKSKEGLDEDQHAAPSLDQLIDVRGDEIVRIEVVGRAQVRAHGPLLAEGERDAVTGGIRGFASKSEC